MAYRPRVQETYRDRVLRQGRLAAARRTLRRFIQKFREEVYTTAYTRLEAHFGEQQVETLETLDAGVRSCLEEVDRRWFNDLERKYRDQDIRPGMKQLHRQGHPLDPVEIGFMRALRDEVLDLMGQFTHDVMHVPHPDVQTWLDTLVDDPELRPEALVEAARRRDWGD